MEDNYGRQKIHFRKKSLEKISSPEDLDSYLVVTRPGVWFTLAAVIVLLVGVLVWAVLGRIDATVGVAVVSKGSESVCYVPYEKAEGIKSSGRWSLPNNKRK